MIALLESAAGAGLPQGRVAALGACVSVALDDGRLVECARLYTSDAGLTLAVGDEVLVALRSAATGIVVGRIGAAPGEHDPLPDELVLEARSSLTLRVGNGSITLRRDGRIVVRGSDLVSHATRMNRIRGGSVDIN